MRIAIVCSKYALEEKNAWLTNELAYAYRDLGHDVIVYCLDWEMKNSGVSYEDHKGIQVNYLKIPDWIKMFGDSFFLFVKWFLLSWMVKIPVNKKDMSIDLLIFCSPAITTAGIVHRLKKYAKHTQMILWDFFPIANAELGLIPKKVELIAKKIEERYINYADNVGLMSVKNIEFFRDYYRLDNMKLSIVSIWGQESYTLNQNKINRINREKINLVFGGQLVEGRGLELLLDIAKLIETHDEIEFVVAGDGRRKEWFLEKIAQLQLKNINFLGRLTRDEYMGILKISDIGLILNSGAATVPTFPSKSIDYLRAAIPLLVAIEPASDAGIIIEEEMQAGYNCDVNNPNDIVEKILYLSKDAYLREKLGLNGYNYFKNNMTAEQVALKILSDADIA